MGSKNNTRIRAENWGGMERMAFLVLLGILVSSCRTIIPLAEGNEWTIEDIIATEQAWAKKALERRGHALAGSDYLNDLLNMDHYLPLQEETKDSHHHQEEEESMVITNQADMIIPAPDETYDTTTTITVEVPMDDTATASRTTTAAASSNSSPKKRSNRRRRGPSNKNNNSNNTSSTTASTNNGSGKDTSVSSGNLRKSISSSATISASS